MNLKSDILRQSPWPCDNGIATEKHTSKSAHAPTWVPHARLWRIDFQASSLESCCYKTVPAHRWATNKPISTLLVCSSLPISKRIYSAMVSSTAVLGTVGVILLTVLGSGLADDCNDPSTQGTVRTTLLNQLNAGSDGQVQFKRLLGVILVNNGPTRTKTDICNALTAHQQAENQGFLGVGISFSQCYSAFSDPDPANLGDWAGKHCFQTGTPCEDDAEWATPSPSQSMTYLHRGNPCCSPYNEISGDVSQ